ncbi:hypothetical protein RSAG8_08433, partial [Rhizoctonia solani AG-8 WAC10335]
MVNLLAEGCVAQSRELLPLKYLSAVATTKFVTLMPPAPLLWLARATHFGDAYTSLRLALYLPWTPERLAVSSTRFQTRV